MGMPNRHDLYVKTEAGWKLSESFSGYDDDKAFAQAETLDSDPRYRGVRVMAVTTYASGRAPLETLVWISPSLSDVAPQTRRPKPAAPQSSAPAPDSPPTAPDSPPTPSASAPAPAAPRTSRRAKPTQPPHRDPFITLAGRLIFAVAAGVIVAAAVFRPLNVFIRTVLQQAGAVNDMTYRLALFTVLILIVVLVATIVLAAILPRLLPSPRTLSPREEARLSEHLIEIPPEPEPPPSNASESIEAAALRTDLPPPETADGTGASDETSDEPDATGESERPAPQSLLSEEDAPPRDSHRDLLHFLAAAFEAIRQDVPTLNAHVRFGLNLFFSGAMLRYGAQYELERADTLSMIREAVSASGTKPEQVDSFCRTLDEHMETPRYRLMIAAGETAMAQFHDDPEKALDPFPALIKIWMSDDAARAHAQGIVAIMFTDLVGSTKMTQQYGDLGAQEVVRTHNVIVRNALVAHGGHEVKHTGDGIMASFKNVPSAIAAAVEIQKNLGKHNRLSDIVPVKVRIGVNAGLAVEEEDDYFGTVVQLAARVCDKANTGEIFITDAVRTLTAGSGFTVAEAGDFELKGIDGNTPLFKVAVD